MPYRICTYVDPYRIAETEFWPEIKNYPQLCASRTLVNGLVSVMCKQIDSLICPIDAISEKKIFSDWSLNISHQIQQYSYLTAEYKKIRDRGEIDDNFYSSISHNKSSMLDSLRLFLELDIEGNKLHSEHGNQEQRLFVYLLKLIQMRKENLFTLPSFPDKKTLINLFAKMAEQERDDYLDRVEKREELNPDPGKMAMYDRAIKAMSTWDGKHVVINGIHQFTPIQLRFIEALDKMRTEIIFLYNFIPEYQEIYSSWNFIYQQFNAPVCHDRNIKSYNPAMLQKPANALASNIAMLCEDTISRTDPRIKSNYALYSAEEGGLCINKFENLSEYAGYVSDIFQEAEQRVQDQPSLYQIPIQRNSGTAKVLAEMEESIYTANKDVDELLQIYHPEYARNRHFLAYPIGQFFVALYELWDCKKKQIRIDYSLIRSCVNSGIISKCDSAELLKTVTNLEILFGNLECYEDFVERMQKYIQLYDSVAKATTGMTGFPLKGMEIYNPYKVSKKDAENLLNTITIINEIATALFSVDGNDSDYIEFKDHFSRLEKTIRECHPNVVNEEEKDLIDHLLIKIDSLKPVTDRMRGTFDDLKSGLYFFLKQKEDPASNWFVKNFEQIDGDILKSKAQNKPGNKKVYHFACVSDKDMNVCRNELLPWPLSEQFIERAYTPKNLTFQVYYASIGERSNFLRYALFYGMYFNHCDTRLSFVKKYGDEETTEYDYLQLLGVRKEPAFKPSSYSNGHIISTAYARPVSKMQYKKEEMETAFLCPYRYLMDYVLNPQPVESGSFLSQKLLENVLVENVWRRLESKDIDKARRDVHKYFQQEKSKLKDYFPFFKEIELYDITKRAENYFVNIIMSEKFSPRCVRKLNANHMSIRKRFGKALFMEELADHPEHHSIEAFEAKTEIKEGKKIYSLNKILEQEERTLTNGLMNYMNNKKDDARVGEWCVYCPNKAICLQSYHESSE